MRRPVVAATVDLAREFGRNPKSMRAKTRRRIREARPMFHASLKHQWNLSDARVRGFLSSFFDLDSDELDRFRSTIERRGRANANGPDATVVKVKASRLRDVGMATRREVLGNAHVDRAEAATTEFDAPFQNLITEMAWGAVWSDRTIDRRERSMLTLALLAATGSFDEIPMHVRATAATGASREDVMQAFLHVAIYAGVPKANRAIQLAKATYDEMDEMDAKAKTKTRPGAGNPPGVGNR